MQAELPQMESTNESLHWLAGGIMSLIKALWSGALYSGNKKELAPAKKPGIHSALVTLAAQNWLFHIENQQAGQSTSLN
jgi:hypothetical protein